MTETKAPQPGQEIDALAADATPQAADGAGQPAAEAGYRPEIRCSRMVIGGGVYWIPDEDLNELGGAA